VFGARAPTPKPQTPNPQSPIPNPHRDKLIKISENKIINFIIKNYNIK